MGDHKMRHMWICGLLITAGIGMALLGVTGAWALLPLIGCVAMMGMMLWMMMGMRHGERDR